MQTAERLEQYERITGREAEDFLARAVKLVQENLPEFTEYFPDSNSEENFYPQTGKQRMDHRLLDRRDLAGL